MAALGDPKYALAIGMRNENGDNVTKTFNYINLKIGSASAGYDVDQVAAIAEKIASIASATYRSSAITAQYEIET